MPIVFYDGDAEWTAETNFINKTEMQEVFEKYVPKFEYELVSLKDYSYEDLANFGGILSLFMMIDKVRNPEELAELGKLPTEYATKLKSLNVPTHLKELLMKVVNVLLTKVPQEEINIIMEKIDERGVSEMLTLDNYSVQETRRQAREDADRQRIEAESRLKVAIKLLLDRGVALDDVALHMNISNKDIRALLP